MESAFRRIAVAAKNTDTREHDIADSDDYFQYHGGMVAMVRSLTGRNPAAYIGDSAIPDAVKTRTLAEETRRVFRARVVNPRWIAAMRRHGYKGAFELAATVDYLFGYDATAGVVPDWMYEQLAASYVFDPENRAFMRQSNPWALRGITERLLEAADRGLWASARRQDPGPAAQVYLDGRQLTTQPAGLSQAVGLRPQARKSRCGMTSVRGSSRCSRAACSASSSSRSSAMPRCRILGRMLRTRSMRRVRREWPAG
jgi:hypothetical protein